MTSDNPKNASSVSITTTIRKGVKTRDLELEESKFQILDQLLLCTSFDRKYWTQDYKLYDQFKARYLDCYVESAFNPNDEKEIKNYLLMKDQKNSWVQYFLGLEGSYNIGNSLDHLIRSIKLGNPYAMYVFIQDFEEKDDPELDKKTLILKAANIGYPKAIVLYINDKLEELEELLNGEDKENQKNILNEFKTNYITPYVQKVEDLEGFNNELAELYNKLYNQFQDPSYYRSFLIHLRDINVYERHKVEEFPEAFTELIDNHLHLDSKYDQLERKYNELLKVKEMDFNAIVSGGVGEFL